MHHDRQYSAGAVALIAIVFALLALLATAGVVYLIQEEGPQVKSVLVDGPDRDTLKDDDLNLQEPGQKVEEATEDGTINRDVTESMRGPDDEEAGKLDGPLAAQEWPGCATRFVKAFSSRGGVRPRAFAVHYTAGPNSPGLADMNGLTAYSNNMANQVSWHFLIDRDGNCYYSVPINHKAWTISGLNSETINVEMVGRGTEPDYGGPAGLKKLGSVIRRVHSIHPHIVIAKGTTDGRCNVTRPGIITHWMGGPCSGGHHDIRPYDLDKLIAAIRAQSLPKLLPCSPLNIEAALKKRYPKSPIIADGRLGDASRAAIRRLQRERGFSTNGLVGPLTGRALGLKGCTREGV